MTCVAFDGATLAADRMVTDNGFQTSITKLKRAKDGAILAYAGTIATCLTLVDWYERGAKVKDWPDPGDEDEVNVLIVVKGGRCGFYQDVPVLQYVEDPIMAWGSGRLCAIGAMHAGADAVHAVQIASKYCAGVGNGVDSMDMFQ